VLQLLSQIMLLLSCNLASGMGSMGAGALAARPAVQSLVDKLVAALASLGNAVFTACRTTAASNVTQQMLAGWLAGLQRQAACGSAADRSVLQLCGAHVQVYAQ
jgi:hypothetical protein